MPRPATQRWAFSAYAAANGPAVLAAAGSSHEALLLDSLMDVSLSRRRRTSEKYRRSSHFKDELFSFFWSVRQNGRNQQVSAVVGSLLSPTLADLQPPSTAANASSKIPSSGEDSAIRHARSRTTRKSQRFVPNILLILRL